MPLKVLHLTNTRYGLGGVETLLLAAADKYDTSEFSVSYCNLFCDKGGQGHFPTALRERGETLYDLPGRSRWDDMPGVVARLVRLMRREQFDVVHSHMLYGTLVGHLAARIAGVPVRIASRQFTEEGFAGKGSYVRALDRMLTRAATHVVAVSEGVRRTLIRDDKIAPEKITVIHNSVDLRALDAARLDAPLPWDESWAQDTVLGFLASLTPRKGHPDLFRALAEVLKVRPDVRLVLVGEGPERAKLEALASELGIADHVLFAGFRSDATALVRHFDLYVHSSHYETFGIALVEAMAARKGIVATITGGIPEVVADGETGLLVPKADPPALAAAILEMLRDPESLRLMGERGRERAERLFNVELTVEKYQELYRRFAHK